MPEWCFDVTNTNFYPTLRTPIFATYSIYKTACVSVRDIKTPFWHAFIHHTPHAHAIKPGASTFIYGYMYVYLYEFIYIHICIYVYIYMYIYNHTNTQTHAHAIASSADKRGVAD